jgi:hypothetical protein
MPAIPSPQTTRRRAPDWSPVVELRQYTLHPGRRDELIKLFDGHLIESQEAAGMRVIGQFRDMDDPDRFVWLRGFPDMARRAEALGSFYGGPLWQQHRDAANATMIDSSDVLLLRPSHPGSGFAVSGCERPARASSIRPPGFVLAAIHSIDGAHRGVDRQVVEGDITNAVTSAGGAVLAFLVTEPSRNAFPALPVRDAETVFVWFAGFPERSDFLTWSQDGPLECGAGGGGAIRPSQVLRLTATARSLVTPTTPACSPAQRGSPSPPARSH